MCESGECTREDKHTFRACSGNGSGARERGVSVMDSFAVIEGATVLRWSPGVLAQSGWKSKVGGVF